MSNSEIVFSPPRLSRIAGSRSRRLVVGTLAVAIRALLPSRLMDDSWFMLSRVRVAINIGRRVAAMLQHDSIRAANGCGWQPNLCAAPRRRGYLIQPELDLAGAHLFLTVGRYARLDNIMNVQLDTSRSIRNDRAGVQRRLRCRRLISATPRILLCQCDQQNCVLVYIALLYLLLLSRAPASK